MAQWRLEAKTRQPRHIVPMLASDAIRSAGGWVGEVHPFGDFQFVVHFEIAAAKRAALEEAFADAEILILVNISEIPEGVVEIAGAITIMLIEPEHSVFGSLGRQPGPL